MIRKMLLALILVHFSSQILAQDKLNTFIHEVGNAIVAYEDLQQFNAKKMRADVFVNMISLVEFEVGEITDSTFTIIGDPGIGKFCTATTFAYIEKNGAYRLTFAPAETTDFFGRGKTIVDPWINRKVTCKD